MRLGLVVVGRMKDGPERELVARYLRRAADHGRGIGFAAVGMTELAESRAARADDRRSQEAAAIRRSLGDGPAICFDERGRPVGSEDIARFLAARRDGGTKSLSLIIGGPDGMASELRDQALAAWSFGAATFPHQIVRILAAEQLYRAMTILSGHPYHRSE